MTDFISFINFFFEPTWPEYLLYIWQHSIHYSVLVLDILLILGISYILFKAWPLHHRMKLFRWPKTKGAGKKLRKDRKFIRQWQKVENNLSSQAPENLKIAVIDADALVDTFLKKTGYTGEHMADRLAHIVPTEVKSLRAVWDAHLLRNSLVHVPGSNVSAAEAKTAVSAFEKFLKELGAI